MEFTKTEVERFEKCFKAGDEKECWNWERLHFKVGYGMFYMRRGKRKTFAAHRLSWMMHTGQEIPEGKLICHHCDNRSCVNPNHLYLGTYHDNNRDTIKRNRGNRTIGESCSWSKLTKEDILRIRQWQGTQKQIAKELGVDPSHISKILSGQHWTHVD